MDRRGAVGTILALALTSGCLAADVTECGDGLICPASAACDEVHHRCVKPAQLVDCVGRADAEICTVTLPDDGVCVDEVCLEAGCGDWMATGSEACDGPDLRGHADCTDLGFYDAGPIACRADCTFDTSACHRECRDDHADPEEDCDGADLKGAVDCASLGYYDHAPLTCTSFCTYDVAACTGRCGDGHVNGPELCDGAPPAGACLDFGYDAGALACASCGVGLAACGQIGWQEFRTSPGGTALSLGGTAADDVWIGTYGGTIMHFDGAAWTSTAFGTGVFAVTGLAAVSRTDAWAVAMDTGSAILGYLLHYDGTAWTAVDAGQTDALATVWAAAADDVYVGGTAELLHWDGAAWSVVPGVTAVRSLWGSAAADVYAVAGGVLRHGAGASWGTVAVPLADGQAWTPQVVGGTGADDVVVAGRRADGAVAIGRWNGVRWAIDVLPVTIAADQSMSAVWGSGPDDIYAVGEGNVAVRFDGTGWAPAGPSVDYPTAVWGVGRDVWLGAGGASVYRYRGVAWRDAAIDNQGLDVWAWSGRDAYVATWVDVERWDGWTWSPMAGTAGAQISVWGNAPDDVFAVASTSGNNVRRFDGASWALDGSLAATLNQVWGTAADDVWAVGAGGAIAHRGGGGWTSVASPTTRDLWDVWASGPTDVFAVGLDGTIVHYDGTAWTAMDSGTTANLWGVWGAAAGEVFAVGDAGTALRWDGATWTPLPTGEVQPLFAVWGTGADDVFAAGTEGQQIITHWDGTRWSPVRPPGGGSVYGIGGVPGHVFFGTSSQLVHELVRTRPWSCRAAETGCGDGVDDDCDGLRDAADPDCHGTILLHELHGGVPDHVELVDRGTSEMNLYGLTLSFQLAGDAAPATYRFPPDAIVRPGEVWRAVGSPVGLQARERALPDPRDEPGRGGWFALCAGPCDLDHCANVLDYAEKAGAGSPPPSPPACATFAPSPIDVGGLPASGASTQSPTRTGYAGGDATGAASDWTIAPASRE